MQSIRRKKSTLIQVYKQLELIARIDFLTLYIRSPTNVLHLSGNCYGTCVNNFIQAIDEDAICSKPHLLTTVVFFQKSSRESAQISQLAQQQQKCKQSIGKFYCFSSMLAFRPNILESHTSSINYQVFVTSPCCYESIRKCLL